MIISCLMLYHRDHYIIRDHVVPARLILNWQFSEILTWSIINVDGFILKCENNYLAYMYMYLAL
jgi:hypothetical protein